jgi:lipopolysaccharide transport system ATP-binding protein
MTTSVIRVSELGKRYRIGTGRRSYKTFREALMETAQAPMRWLTSRKSSVQPGSTNFIWALNNVSFEIEKGDTVGLIGRNGAGKSTLLKVLARITRPTVGRATIHGRVGSLLEVGTGFHPELTGRENIYLNGAILGMHRSEIDRKFDEIVGFSDIEKFLDTPVKYYSSGMYMRLAFSVAAHLETEILLVDEVLAVGDMAFQEKCLGKMGQVAKEGRTLIFVSHNLSAIWSLCRKAFWLDKGTIQSAGVTQKVIGAYRDSFKAQGTASLEDTFRRGSGRFRFTNFHLEDADGSFAQYIQSGQGISFVLDYETQPGYQFDDLVVFISIANDLEVRLMTLTNSVSGDRLTNLPLRGSLKCFVPELPLIPGEYNLSFACRVKRELEDELPSAAKVRVVEGDFFGSNRLPPKGLGEMLVKHKWQVGSLDMSSSQKENS